MMGRATYFHFGNGELGEPSAPGVVGSAQLRPRSHTTSRTPCLPLSPPPPPDFARSLPDNQTILVWVTGYATGLGSLPVGHYNGSSSLGFGSML